MTDRQIAYSRINETDDDNDEELDWPETVDCPACHKKMEKSYFPTHFDLAHSE